MGKPKRPRPGRGWGNERGDVPELAKPTAPPAAAFVRAYEADLGGRGGYAPIAWAGDADGAVTADRYNIIHLLSDLPSPRAASVGSASSSWSSVDEDAFDLSGDEVAAHARSRREAWVAELRETRLREREAEDAAATAAAAVADDEEPPPDVAAAMAHTARALAASPNPALLEMRIVARHASDTRFAFLRGRWAGAWARVKSQHGVAPPLRSAPSVKPPPPPKATPNSGLGLGYASDSDSDVEDVTTSHNPNPRPPSDPPPTPPRPPSETPPPTPPPPSEPQ